MGYMAVDCADRFCLSSRSEAIDIYNWPGYGGIAIVSTYTATTEISKMNTATEQATLMILDATNSKELHKVTLFVCKETTDGNIRRDVAFILHQASTEKAKELGYLRAGGTGRKNVNRG